MRLPLLLTLALAACGPDARPTPTGTVCPDPDPRTFGFTADDTPGCTGTAEQCNFGETFANRYCISCHDSALPRSKRNGAPLFHDFDSLEFVLRFADHVDEQAGFGPDAENTFMPPARCPSVPGGSLDIDCPQPTDEERRELAVWLACEQTREHTF